MEEELTGQEKQKKRRVPCRFDRSLWVSMKGFQGDAAVNLGGCLRGMAGGVAAVKIDG